MPRKRLTIEQLRPGQAEKYAKDFKGLLDINTEEHAKKTIKKLDTLYKKYKRDKDEHGMHLAAATAFRSADLSRQVGASLMDQSSNIQSTGCNEVPRALGGSYWDGETDDARDFKLGRDANDQKKAERFEVLQAALEEEGIAIEKKTLNQALKISGLHDITEYGRSVHAEMDAIMSCTRRGVPTKWSTLYCTTFPCHNCARHIVAAGINRVVYIEPYPKSEAYSLHYDSIVCPAIPKPTSGAPTSHHQVNFEPFVGVAPRRMSDFFNLRHLTGRLLDRKDKVNGRRVPDIPAQEQLPRLQLSPHNYFEREFFAIEFVNGFVPSKGVQDELQPKFGGSESSEASPSDGEDVAKTEASVLPKSDQTLEKGRADSPE